MKIWEEIQKGWVGHDDQKLVSMMLRMDIARQSNDFSYKVGAILCQIISLHTAFARPWLWLADWYEKNNKKVLEFWTLATVRQVNILEGVNFSINKELIERRIANSDVDKELQDRIQTSVCERIKSSQNSVEESNEFIDLGTSARMKLMEEELTCSSTEHYDENFDECTVIMTNFETKWFCF